MLHVDFQLYSNCVNLYQYLACNEGWDLRSRKYNNNEQRYEYRKHSHIYCTEFNLYSRFKRTVLVTLHRASYRCARQKLNKNDQDVARWIAWDDNWTLQLMWINIASQRSLKLHTGWPQTLNPVKPYLVLSGGIYLAAFARPYRSNQSWIQIWSCIHMS